MKKKYIIDKCSVFMAVVGFWTGQETDNPPYKRYT